MTDKKKLIEVALPLEAINQQSAREKSIRHGHPSTLHLWWARRPLAACRAVLFAQLVDDPSSHPELFPSEEDQAVERKRLFDIIERFVSWENINDARVMGEARAEIARSFNGELPAVLDPFAGGGSIPLEAKRLGLTAIGNDLNPLPALLNLVMLGLVDRFHTRGPVSGGISGTPAHALAMDLRHYAAILEERVRSRAGHLYPRRPGGGEALVYFWARTVRCPNPACGVEVPLVGSWKASARRGSEAFFRPVLRAEQGVFDVEVVNGRGPEPDRTMHRTGGTCPACSATIPLAYIKQEGVEGRLGERMLAVQERFGRQRSFAPATDEDREVADVSAPECEWLDPRLSTHPQYMAPPRYGLTRFVDLFLPRQLVILHAFISELDAVQALVEADARQAGLPAEEPGYASGGTGAVAYAEAIRILLALGLGRFVNRQSTLCIWNAPRNTVEQVFARQAYSMTWFFAEANPFAGASGSFSGQIDFLAKAVEALPQGDGAAHHGPAQSLDLPSPVVVCTDPPYYDNVPYADLADFFYVWLRRMLANTLPSLFSTVLTPKSEELVADQIRLGGRAPARAFFEQGMLEVFERLACAQDPDVPMTVFYAFKQTEEVDDSGAASTGWETMLEALIASGWSIVGTWPMRTEQPGGLRELGRNALASSVVIVCRRQRDESQVTTRREFIKALHDQLPTALKELQQGSIAPVDLAQAAIGPGMAVFTSYRSVMEADGSRMSVRAALGLINQVLDRVLAEQESEFDLDTRWAVAWFEQYGTSPASYGVAETLALAKNTAVSAIVESGILESRAGKVRLLRRDELPEAWDPEADRKTVVWEVTQHLIRRLDAEGEAGAAALLQKVGPLGEAAKDLAYRLFAVCEKKGWTDDALAYNSLVVAWPHIARLAAEPASTAPEQATMDV